MRLIIIIIKITLIALHVVNAEIENCANWLVADPGFPNGGRQVLSVEGASIEAPRDVITVDHHLLHNRDYNTLRRSLARRVISIIWFCTMHD